MSRALSVKSNQDLAHNNSAHSEECPVIATYRDLNQVSYEKLLKQRKQFMFTIAFILLCSSALVGYQQITKNNSNFNKNLKPVATLKE